MTTALDFATLPPEINSARMYSGAGSAPMVAAASAWKGLAAELRSTALSYGSVLSALTDDKWHGPASASMAASAAPYVAWMNTTAVQAEQTATQAEAAAAAYEAAFAATVPPSVVAANRALLMALIATNIVGQNTPAIAATEAHYAEMWAQDATAMYGYASSSAVATELTPFTEPQQTTNSSGLAAQSAAVSQAAATPAGSQQTTLSQLISTLPDAVQGLASPGWNPFAPGSASETPGLNGMLNLFGNNTAFGQFINANIWNSIFGSGNYLPSNTMGPFMGLLSNQTATAANAASDAAGQAATGALGEALAGPLNGIGSLGNPVSASLGQGALVGTLSVPPSWTAAAPLNGGLSATLGATPMIGPPAMAAGMPPVPVGGAAGTGLGRAVPQYGFRPTFVARPPAAG
jgi:PPE-repeat protein